MSGKAIATKSSNGKCKEREQLTEQENGEKGVGASHTITKGGCKVRVLEGSI